MTYGADGKVLVFT